MVGVEGQEVTLLSFSPLNSWGFPLFIRLAQTRESAPKFGTQIFLSGVRLPTVPEPFWLPWLTGKRAANTAPLY